MASRKKPVQIKPIFDARLIAAVGEAELVKLKRDGYAYVYLYETNGLVLDQWVNAYFAARHGGEESVERDIEQAVKQGRARKVEKVAL